jgi:AraC-like DNA-binding protein
VFAGHANQRLPQIRLRRMRQFTTNQAFGSGWSTLGARSVERMDSAVPATAVTPFACCSALPFGRHHSGYALKCVRFPKVIRFDNKVCSSPPRNGCLYFRSLKKRPIQKAHRSGAGGRCRRSPALRRFPMRETGFTKARSNGALADAVESRGGSIARVFARAELPLSLIDQPEMLVPLRDQVHLLEYASREIGDDALSARLASEAGIPGLGVYGDRLLSAPSLEAAIARASLLIGALLQSSTSLRLDIDGPRARWTYDISVSTEVGRQKHDILALGYMLDLLRRFAGPRWTPPQVKVVGPPTAGRAAVQDVLSCELSRGDVSAIVFPSELLELPSLRPGPPGDAGIVDSETPVHDPSDIVKCVEQLIRLALLEGRPRIDWVARKLDLSGRSLQRHLAIHDTTFEAVMDRVFTRHATTLLEQGGMPTTQVALQLGYADPSHFVRAFRRWTGQTPREFRRSLRITRTGMTAD